MACEERCILHGATNRETIAVVQISPQDQPSIFTNAETQSCSMAEVFFNWSNPLLVAIRNRRAPIKEEIARYFEPSAQIIIMIVIYAYAEL
jgi:hypothetical protein